MKIQDILDVANAVRQAKPGTAVELFHDAYAVGFRDPVTGGAIVFFLLAEHDMRCVTSLEPHTSAADAERAADAVTADLPSGEIEMSWRTARQALIRNKGDVLRCLAGGTQST